MNSLNLNPTRLMGRSLNNLAWRLTSIGLVVTVIFLVLACTANAGVDWGWLQDPTEALSNPIHVPPSGRHWFGTSRQGYDIFSRTVFGSQAALKVVLLATGLSLVIGVPLGMVRAT